MKGKRIISSLLSMAMVFTLNAGMSFAEEAPVTEEPVVEEQPVEEPAVVEEQPVIEEEPVVPEEQQLVQEEPAVETQEEETEEEEAEYPAQTFTGVTPDGMISVEVNAPEGALPKDASMRVENVNSDAIKGLVESVIDGEADTISAVNVIFTDAEGHEVEPLVEIIVNIKMVDFEAADSYQLVHIDQANHPDKIADEKIISINNTEATFATDVFSVYAVIGQEGPEANYRMTVNFYNGNTLIATMYVKNSDSAEQLKKILYDPGAGTVPPGQSFNGWAKVKNYTEETPTQTIEDIRTEIEAKQITDGEVVDYYAVFTTTYTLSYRDEDGAIIGSQAVTSIASNTSKDITVNMDYVPHESTHNFEGWNVYSGQTNIEKAIYQGGDAVKPYQNGTVLTIKGNVTLSVNAPPGHWLIFDENGDHATYNAPQFVKDSEVTKRPRPDSEMIRAGYSFRGWYKDEQCTEEFEFGNQINEETKIYAGWELIPSAPYSVVIWKENINCNGYDYSTTKTLYGAPDTQINTVTMSGSGDNAYVTIDGNRVSETGFHADRLEGATQKINPNGSTVVNVYLNRNSYTFTFRAGRNHQFYYDGNLDVYRSYDPINIHTVTKKYDQDISDIWSFRGSDGYNYPETNANTSWLPSGSSTYTTRITTMQRMPAENITFTLLHTNRTKRYHYYYIEAVPGKTGQRKFNGKQYDLYLELPNDFNYVYYNEEFFTLKGFSKQVAAKSNDDVVPISVNGTGWDTINYYYGGNNNQLYFYYTRDKYNLTFLDGTYFDANETPIAETNQGKLHEVIDTIYYEQDISSYNKGGKDYFVPTRENYTFAGWYQDKACTKPYTFTTMPLDGVTVYAKWILNQYRVFLHPNAGTDPNLDWGSDTQGMTFRISAGEKVSAPEGKRGDEYEFVGWYLDPNFTQVFNDESYVLNDSTVKTPYNKEDDYTDPMDKWGNGATYNSDINRDWITKKLDLYARWVAVLVGATGINVEYYANGGTNPPTDTLLYTDNSAAVAQPASTAPAEKVFDHWVVQTWNGSEYVDTETTVLPGANFWVLKANARIEKQEGSTEENPKYKYTVRLKAVYSDKDKETPTHITWHANNGKEPEETITDDKNADGQPLKINEPIDIRDADTFTNPGYTFIGWAKQPNASKNDLFLKYEGEEFYAKDKSGAWVKVTQVAADEVQAPDYDHLYAIWECKIYVWHSSTATKEEINVNELPNGILNLYERVNEDGYLYGGWYTAYNGDDTKPYNDIVGNRNSPWSLENKGNRKGDSIQIDPVQDHDRTFYLKEVPDAYLSNYTEMIYKIDGGAVQNIFQMSAVDDLNYTSTGFIIRQSDNPDRPAHVVRSFIFRQDSGKSSVCRADLIFNGINNLSYLTYLSIQDFMETGTSITVQPYWVTPDGITVKGKTRTVNMGDLTINQTGVTVQD